MNPCSVLAGTESAGPASNSSKLGELARAKSTENKLWVWLMKLRFDSSATNSKTPLEKRAHTSRVTQNGMPGTLLLKITTGTGHAHNF